ncbi:uncharacterized protein LOC100367134 [Saccoglossus kowalevskii]|uniref:Cytokine-like nuclear factor N-PAC n=1 Tax=Saccoglossus kowalevskii TaxID=10224 RepID=A0ABM0GV74_SACKO|nr:PREDICTED: putative oxidoreductase GLYR1-like [Saccoglossus kowalevskii]
MAAKFNLGDLVWAKLSSFPAWPGKVVRPMKNVKKPTGKKPVHFIFFFGTQDYAWVKDDNLKPYVEYKEKLSKAAKGIRFQRAIEAIEDVISNMSSDRSRALDRQRPPPEGQEDDIFPKARSKKDYSRFLGKPKGEVTKTTLPPQNPISNKTSYASKRTSEAISSRRSSESSGSTGLATKRSRTQVNHVTPLSSSPAAAVPSSKEIVSEPKVVKDRISPTIARVGFIGLGTMGHGMATSLINSGHTLTVWNRTDDKCNDIVTLGASKAASAAEVVQTSDITFCSVADPEALRDVVFNLGGVLEGIKSGKGFVSMSTVDAETSKDVNEAVTARGGRFLEAPVLGSKKQSIDGTLIILSAGDKTLFQDCESSFSAMSKKFLHLGNVGSATQMKIALNLLFGSVTASLAESMALAEKAGLDCSALMDILTTGLILDPMVKAQGKAMLNDDYPLTACLNNMQKDMRLVLSMGDEYSQQLPVAAAVNEMYKKAKSLGHGDEDMSAIYKAYSQ